MREAVRREGKAFVEWAQGSGEISVQFTEEGIWIEGFYFTDAGTRNNSIGPVLLRWVEVERMRKEVAG